MKLLVVGAKGSIGVRRAGILEDLGHTVTRIDIETTLSAQLAKQHDAALICTPPQTQVQLAYLCAEQSVPFFVEKPGATNFREYLKLVGMVQKRDIPNMVACNLRFTTEYRAIQDSLPNIGKPIFALAEFGFFLPWWRQGNHRTYYSCFRMAGGGVLLDAIHELDYVSSLFGMPSEARVQVGKIHNTGEIDIDAEDAATLFMLYKNGPSTTIHVDYLQRTYKRTFSCVGTKGRIDQTFNVQGSNAMYRAEMQHFLDCVKRGKETVKPVEQHGALLEFIDKIKASTVAPTDEEEQK